MVARREAGAGRVGPSVGTRFDLGCYRGRVIGKGE